MSDLVNTFFPELPGLQGLYYKLLRADLAGQLPGESQADSDLLSKDEIRRLIGYASILSLSSNASDKGYAYEVATRLIELHGRENNTLVAAVDLVLSRLGNFPGRRLLRNRYSAAPSDAPPVPLRLRLERAAREIENSITQPGGVDIPLTDFQYELYSALDANASVSVSAPTSAGKSFVMGLDLVRRLSKGRPACVVYLVPTRALIREVTVRVRRDLRMGGMESIPVRSVPFPITKESAPHGAVYVLTQERLMSLLHSPRGEPWITTLVVDEAQGIQDGARGIILQSAVEAVLRRFPQAEVHFASPLAKNPEYLLSLVGRLQGKAITEVLSPVSKNLILVSEVYGKPKQAKYEVLLNKERVDLGVRNLGFALRGSVYQQRAALAKSVTGEDESTILFANYPSDAEDLAEALVDGMEELHQHNPDVQEFIEFLRNEIHPEYPLIKTLPYSVAFHYGDMPSIVRARVEDLFKKGTLKYICCTSTLLQGVNLPARHIIIENPKRGSGKAMTRRDFLNLAGRAGRLLQEFHGNIWCLRPAKWDEQCYEGEALQEIHSAMSEAMADGGTVIQRLLVEKANENEVDVAEAALGKIYSDFVVTGKNLLESEFKSQNNEAVLGVTAKKCGELRVTLPREVLDANRSVRPDRLQGLYDYLGGVSDPSALIPLKPGTVNANQRMEEIIRIVQKYLAGIDDNSYLFYKWLAIQWIYNKPIRQIIAERIEHLRGKGDVRKPSSIIRELLKALERDIRFRLVKYYMAYTSVLGYVLRERGESKLADSMEPFHVYLECGASDPVALSLLALGLSRVTALVLREKIAFEADDTPEECLAKLRKANLEHLHIAALCIREVRELLF